jgi:hypothetical protein
MEAEEWADRERKGSFCVTIQKNGPKDRLYISEATNLYCTAIHTATDMCGKLICRRELEALLSGGGCNKCACWVVFVENMAPAEARMVSFEARTVSVKRSWSPGQDGADHGVRGG